MRQQHLRTPTAPGSGRRRNPSPDANGLAGTSRPRTRQSLRRSATPSTSTARAARCAEVSCAGTAGSAGFPCSGRLAADVSRRSHARAGGLRHGRRDRAREREVVERCASLSSPPPHRRAAVAVGKRACRDDRRRYRAAYREADRRSCRNRSTPRSRRTDACSSRSASAGCASLITTRPAISRGEQGQRTTTAPAITCCRSRSIRISRARSSPSSLQTAPSPTGAVFRLVRYRELRGTLAERAILLETSGADPPRRPPPC